ncbi:DUF2510 domain-containing protein [Streptomyces sp. NPDC057376]|uniref:DUF2510 domain-containing protein n=1 Tax=unclassified Streptomyces TaxID=2593676 RepID=UPI00093D6911|nr:DUF2510 domain-containing protein [Streptomyces sp. CB02414]OKI85266.1 hypothetical protein AMK11_16760 [Streptomyces sp. CB02414]
MTQVTPPGWYPDPGQKQDGPATERWWDGRAWTDQVRPAGPAAAAGPPPEQPPAPSPGPAPAQPAAPGTAAGPYPASPGYPVHPGYPGYPVQPPSARRRRLRTGIAVAAAVAVLAGIGAGVYVLTDDGSGGGSASSQQDRRGPGGQNDPFGGEGGGGGEGGNGESPAPESPGESEPPTIDSGSVTDPVNDISLPIPDGWSGQQFPVGATVTSDDSYECPGDPAETCTKGGAYSAPQEVLETKGGTAEEVAKADIEANAEESYGDAYGGITSHEELASKSVTVAGQKGWLVRWKAVTKEGSDGYVESLAFPAPADPERIVVVRFGVDVEEGVSVIDEITEGIEVDSSGGGGGTGQGV